jgi:hypothetical protein
MICVLCNDMCVSRCIRCFVVFCVGCPFSFIKPSFLVSGVCGFDRFDPGSSPYYIGISPKDVCVRVNSKQTPKTIQAFEAFFSQWEEM